MEEYVYVLMCDNHIIGENEESECLGVFRNLESAQNRLKEEIEKSTKQGWVNDDWYTDGDMGTTMYYGIQENFKQYFDLLIVLKVIE